MTGVFRDWNRPTTAKTYARQLLAFCELVSTEQRKYLPDTLLDMKLEEVEDLAEDHVRRFNGARSVNIRSRVLDDVKEIFLRLKFMGKVSKGLEPEMLEKYQVAPKRLNVQISALIKWLVANRVIKSGRQFRQLKFERSKTIGSSLMASSLDDSHIREMFSMANGVDSIVLGGYALQALRPSLLPTLRVKNLHPRSYKIENGKLVWTKMPPLVIVPWMIEGEYVVGNKAAIEFPSFIPTMIAEKIRVYLNSRKESVTPDTRLYIVRSKDAVDYVVRKYYKMVGYDGRPYDLRSFGSRLLKHIELDFNDKDLKEFLMGHSAEDMARIYDFRGMSTEQEAEIRRRYSDAVDKFIDENVFSALPADQKHQAEVQAALASQLGVSLEAIEIIKKKLLEGAMTMTQFSGRLAELIKSRQQDEIVAAVDRAISERLPMALEHLRGTN